MKIDGNNPYIRPEYQVPQRELPTSQERPKVQEQKSSKDRLEFSTTSRELQYLVQKAGDIDTLRAERVNEIKARVDAGTYDIRAQEVAESIMTGFLVDKSA